jgi:hypothetical protein
MSISPNGRSGLSSSREKWSWKKWRSLKLCLTTRWPCATTTADLHQLKHLKKGGSLQVAWRRAFIDKETMMRLANDGIEKTVDSIKQITEDRWQMTAKAMTKSAKSQCQRNVKTSKS